MSFYKKRWEQQCRNFEQLQAEIDRLKADKKEFADLNVYLHKKLKLQEQRNAELVEALEKIVNYNERNIENFYYGGFIEIAKQAVGKEEA